MNKEKSRCPWCGADSLYMQYHDTEWGVMSHDDAHLFEMLILEGAQAGLSWLTVLRRREGYRQAFAGFDPQIIARYDDADRKRLQGDSRIIRNRLKIESAIKNSQAVLAIQEEFGSFDAYLWRFVNGDPIIGQYQIMDDVPVFTEEATLLSKDLKKRGCSFVGPVIIYSFMQSVGMVNDHLVSCFRYHELGGRA